ncbi:MAG: glycosyltransferase family 4 protein [Methanobacterium sp.]|jgi:glycosyltransferase involved in cell wall biosynthesis
MKNKHNLIIILFPLASQAPYYFANDIINILIPITNNLFIITGNSSRINNDPNLNIIQVPLSVHYAQDKKPIIVSYIWWIIKCIIIQLYMTYNLFMMRKEIDIILYMAYPFNFLPLIIGKLFKKKNIEYMNRSLNYDKNVSSNIMKQINNLDFYLMDVISPQSESLLQRKKFKNIEKKISVNSSRYIQYNKNFEVNIDNRKNVIGFVSRIVKKKGIIEFINSIPIILEERQDVEFLIAGDGDLVEWAKDEIKKIEEKHDVNIKFLGWIPRKDILEYLKTLKILVLPTNHPEALPTIVLEAMSVGTPVLTTPIGGIREVIHENYTGFIMEDVSSENIAYNVLSILNQTNLKKISENQIDLIENRFSYESAVKRWTKILNHDPEK